MKIGVGVSNHHVHLTENTFKKLFGEEAVLECRNALNQPGQFASTVTVDLQNGSHKVSHVRVVGPLRAYDQVELSQTDAQMLGLNPPRRQSGDLQNTLPITLIGPKGSVRISGGVILALRHVHMNPEMARKLHLKMNDAVVIKRDNVPLFDAYIKVGDPAFFELHIDTDEAKTYNLQTGDILELEYDENR